jgi:hypothetical protein
MVARQVPSPQSASDSHVCPAERRHPPRLLSQPSAPQSDSRVHTPSAHCWCVAPEQRRSSSPQGAAGKHALPSAAQTSAGPHAAAQQTLPPSSVATQLLLAHVSGRVHGSPSSSPQPAPSHVQASPSRAAGLQVKGQSATVAHVSALQLPCDSRSS